MKLLSLLSGIVESVRLLLVRLREWALIKQGRKEAEGSQAKEAVDAVAKDKVALDKLSDPAERERLLNKYRNR